MGSLSVLKLYGVKIGWGQVAFSNRLVKLHLQEINLGYDIILAQIMTALSSATELRQLNFISVKSFPDPTSPQSTTIRPKISLPNLETLVAQDLYSNTLNSLLSSITSRSHQLTLHLTMKALQIARPMLAPWHVSPSGVIELLSNVTVDTLLLDEGNWLSTTDFWEILNAMPNLETLRINFWVFDESFHDFQPINAMHNQPSGPHIKNVHIHYAKIFDEDAFKKMVASCSKGIEWMQLGATVRHGSGDSEVWESLEEEDELAVWLEKNVRGFELMYPESDCPEFHTPGWQLW
ncbi:hypothetical protein FRC11_009331 [Ceratobasidium sp. 423]|nr:hypothetical protein FRC11_009331 [Ceratobasidium sp. 423]